MAGCCGRRLAFSTSMTARFRLMAWAPVRSCPLSVARTTDNGLLEFLNQDMPKLHQARRPFPLLGLGVERAVVLQGDGSTFRNVRQLGIGNHLFAVELDPEAVALHGDLKGVPFAAGPVGAFFGGNP